MGGRKGGGRGVCVWGGGEHTRRRNGDVTDTKLDERRLSNERDCGGGAPGPTRSSAHLIVALRWYSAFDSDSSDVARVSISAISPDGAAVTLAEEPAAEVLAGAPKSPSPAAAAAVDGCSLPRASSL
jgi:hypothetical protein